MLKIFLYLLSIPYKIIASIRNTLYDAGLFKSHEFRLPVIAVGNLAVGGTGKTPHVQYLATLLKREFKIAILSRGYKRSTKGFIISTHTSTAKEIGDEPRLLKNNLPNVEVVVDANRVRGIKRIIKEKPATNAILLDDGFQHRNVKPGLAILLTDYNNPFYEDYHLPYGRLREGRTQMQRANIIIVTKTPIDASPMDKRVVIKKLKTYPYQNVYFSYIKYGNLKPIQEFCKTKRYEMKPDDDFKSKKYSILLVTGIAMPAPLLEHIKNYSSNVEHINFPDHYSFKMNDIKRIQKSFDALSGENKIIVTTEKDAVRLSELIKKEINYDADLPFYIQTMNIDFDDTHKREFNNEILNYVRKNKGYDGFFKNPI